MRSSSHCIVLGAALALEICAGAARADAPYDPTAQGIDRVCDAFVASAAARDVVTLARVPLHDGSVPNWHRSDAATVSRSKGAPDFPGGDFATVVFDRESIVFASDLHVDPGATGTQTRAWCFIGGKLSRATIDIFDAVADSGWQRRLYYGDDLERPLSERFVTIGSHADPSPHARPPLDRLNVDAFATPAKLPFRARAVEARGATTKRS